MKDFLQRLDGKEFAMDGKIVRVVVVVLEPEFWFGEEDTEGFWNDGEEDEDGSTYGEGAAA